MLASASPRRSDLLTEAGFDFRIRPSPAREIASSHLSLREITLRNATIKALAVARGLREGVILAADTLVALDGELIGKPRSLQAARKILRRLSGRTHQVCTGVSICDAGRGKSAVFTEISDVHFHSLSRERIEKYLARIAPLDKAGAYAAQGSGAEIIERIDGSYTNVVGLPMESTVPLLRQFGILPRRRREL